VPAVAVTEAVTIKQVPKRKRWRIVILAPNRFERAYAGGGRSGAKRPTGASAREVLLSKAIGAL
jgi:hypothetical protein